MVDSTDTKRTLKLTKIFRPQPTQPRMAQSQRGSTRAEARPMVISSPILQHSSSVYSLVSPTRSPHCENGTDKGQDIPPWMLSPPPSSSPRLKKGSNVTRTASAPGMQETIMPTPASSPRTPSYSRHTVAHSSLAAHYQRIQNLTDRISSLPPSPSTSVLRKRAEQKGLGSDSGISDQAFDDSFIRRHSCSSTAFRSKQKRVGATASPASSAAAFAAMPPVPIQSKSTPLHKVKTYNVHHCTPKKGLDLEGKLMDAEKQRKMQELEELISGRRGSTLKLSLTPKVVS